MNMEGNKKNDGIKSWVFIVIVGAIIILVGSGIFLAKRQDNIERNNIANMSTDLKDFETLLMRYDQLSRVSILTLQEMDEKKEIRERIKKYYDKQGERGKEQYQKFLRMYGE